MEKKSRKMLLIGIVGALVVLAVVLALVLTQCTGGPAQAEPTESTPVQTEGYELYWNVDRKEFDGKSEAGMSSRKMQSDGYFHVRFFKDGEMLELKVADRKLINTIDTNDLMGLTFDEDGIVVGVTRVDRMPVERVGWLFYVQSTGGNLIKLNSSRRFDGLEVLVEVEDYTAIYDMTGLEGEVGRRVSMPSEFDRVIAIADMQGRVTHVFVTDRSEFMFSMEAECQHCKQTVTWKEFTKTNEFPTMSGHYILQNDIKLKGSQVQLPEDCSICVDLNGKTVSKTDGGRMIALFNPGCKLALMDSSEDQSGTILVTGESTQGVGIWLRYGEFHFYGGTIDATAANTRSGGAAVALDANTFMYMHGGTIRGGNAKTEYNAETNSYSRGMGGAVLVAGKFVMNGGVIEDGKAIPIVSYNAKGQPVNNRGYGGNILARGAATLELNGGIIRGGYAGSSGGNIYVDGTAELLLNGTQVQGGYVDGRGCNGGSIYVGSKASATMTGGSVTGGQCFNEGGNIYCSGTFTMQGGYIGGGLVYTYGTGKLKENCSSQNLFLVNGSLNHYGGTIAGGVHAIDASKTRSCTVVLAGSPVIDGGKDCKVNLNLNTSGDGVKLVVGKLTDYARIGVSSVGIFSEKTGKENADNFFSDLGADVIHYQERLAVGKLGCICGSESHYGECDGTEHLFVPHTKDNTLPLTEGFWYLTQDIQLTGQQNIRGQQDIVLDLSGHTVTTADGARGYALFDPELPITLTLTDSSKEKTGTIKAVGQNVQAEGQCVWIRTAGQTLNLYDVTLDASEAVNARNGAALYGNAGTTINMYAGRITGGTVQAYYRETSKAVVNGLGGNVYTNGVFIMHGGSISGGKALSGQNADQVYVGGLGGNLATGPNAEVALLGGTISGGEAHTSGGNIYVSGSKAVRLSGVAVSGGLSGNEERKISGSGGNIAVTGNLALESGSVTGGVTNGNGGNIHLTAAADGAVAGGTVSGGTAARGGNISAFGKLGMYGGLVSGGAAEAGGNVFVYGAKAQAALHGGALEDGAASGMGGNLYVGADGAAADLKKISITGGTAARGGNLAMAQKCAVALQTDLNSGTAKEKGGNIYQGGGQLVLVSGTVSGGSAPTGGNIYLNNTAELTQRGGSIRGGKATENGGNVFVAAGAVYDLADGAVEKGIITRDGAANIDVRGTLNMTGGTVGGGSRVDANGQTVALSAEKINLFAYKAHVIVSGGKIAGGMMVHTADTSLQLSGDVSIEPELGKPGLTLNGGAVIGGGTLTDSARVVVSNGADTCISLVPNKTGIVSDKPLVVSAEADNKLYLRTHTHCTVCDRLDGSHADNCQGVDEVRQLWRGGDISESGIYCLHDEIEIGKTATITASDVTILVEGKLSSTRQALWIKEGAKVTLTGNGIIEATGVDGETTGVVGVLGGELNIRGVTLQQVASTNNVKTGGVIRVTGGQVNMYSGSILGGKAVNGGSVDISGGSFTMYGGTIENGKAVNGGNIYLGSGSFTMAEDGDGNTVPVIRGGTATGAGGNVRIEKNAQFTLSCGSIEKGKMADNVDGAGNIDVRGTFIMQGGSVSGGYGVDGDGNSISKSRDKRNIFSVNGSIQMSGGEVDGGVTAYGASSQMKVSRNARIVSQDAAQPSLRLMAGALLTVDGTLESTASIVLSDEAGTCISAQTEKTGLSSDKGLLLSAEADGKLYLRKHTHCSANCGQLDGKHADSCTGYDVAGWTEWDGGDITASGNYCLHGTKTINAPAEISASDVTILVEGKLASTKRALNIKSGADVTLLGSGIIEAKGVSNENTGVVIVDGKLTIDGVTVQQVADASINVKNGGVITVGSTGQVTMESGTIQGGKASNGGGNVFVNGGSFTLKGGSIQNGTALVGGNIFLYGSGSFTMADDGNDSTIPLITGGYATGRNGGNVNISAGAEFTLASGSVENGYQSGGDGVGNIYVGGTLNISGGTVSGGYRVNDDGITVNTGSQIKRNVFAVDGTVNMSGGQIDGGVTIHNNKASSSLKVSKAAKIESFDQTKPSLTLSNGALLAVDGTLNNADIVLSDGADTKLAASGSHAYKNYFTSDKGLVVSVEADGMYLRTHTHCSANCGQLDGKHADSCTGYDVAGWTEWDGGDITAAGSYCLHEDKTLNGPATVSAKGVTLLVNANLSSAKQALVIDSGAEVTLTGSGTVAGKGENGGKGGVVYVNGGKLTVQSLTLQQTADSAITVEYGGVIYVASGSVTLESGTVQSGTASYGGNIYVAGGSVVQSGALVSGGSAKAQASAATKAQGGNISIASGATYTLKSGTVQDGNMAALDGAGNIDVRGTFIMEGGTVTGGYRAAGGNNDVKNNIFAVNSTVQLSGGQIDGGVMIFSTAADRAQLQVGQDAKIVANSAGKGLTLYQSKVTVDTATITANASLKFTGNQSNGTMAAGLVTAQSKDGVTMTQSVKSLFGADAGGSITVGSTSYKLSLEKDNKLYVRAGDAHIHCLCGRTDGTHAEGCGGWDVVFEPTTSFPTASGNYYLNAAQVKANQLQLGTSDGSTNVSINLCLAGKEVTNDSGKARIALIWGGSSLTVTDCGSGTIKANATTGNGGIFHPAKNSNLTIYKGALDAGTVSSAKPGVAIDNAGTTKIYGGQVLGGNATAENANGTGGAIRNTGTLLIAGGTVSGGKAAYRGGNIYSENGSVTISGGSVLNGWVCNDSSNIDVRGGSLTVSGGTISGGNRYTNNTYTAVHASGEVKRNIFTFNTTVVISGGEIDGGVQLHKTSGGSVTISGAPKIASSEAGKKNLSTSYQLVIGKPGLDAAAQIKVTSAPAGALAVAESGLTLTTDMANCFTNDSGTKATLENNQILFK